MDCRVVGVLVSSLHSELGNPPCNEEQAAAPSGETFTVTEGIHTIPFTSYRFYGLFKGQAGSIDAANLDGDVITYMYWTTLNSTIRFGLTGTGHAQSVFTSITIGATTYNSAEALSFGVFNGDDVWDWNSVAQHFDGSGTTDIVIV